MKEEQETGYLFEVDLIYPEELHEKHNDLPYCPENTFDGTKLPKLLTTLYYDKKNYVTHYLNLQQALKAGLKLGKIHKVVSFSQSAWMRVYIEKKYKFKKGRKKYF
ncbi:uncharacterized protein LOC100574819 [Acyrthosiphon pisum]|uniref:Uncharacterized protein n=1 Tax=Acyrthosiphon pisum TaxID=7029 RepID=A0A8R2NSU6_ACYPI|nr:uncharacterized protein LOC100574819 [Acyrthosiphon pisum]